MWVAKPAGSCVPADSSEFRRKVVDGSRFGLHNLVPLTCGEAGNPWHDLVGPTFTGGPGSCDMKWQTRPCELCATPTTLAKVGSKDLSSSGNRDDCQVPAEADDVASTTLHSTRSKPKGEFRDSSDPTLSGSGSNWVRRSPRRRKQARSRFGPLTGARSLESWLQISTPSILLVPLVTLRHASDSEACQKRANPGNGASVGRATDGLSWTGKIEPSIPKRCC